MEKNKDLMTEGHIYNKIIVFALPIFLGNLFQQLYNAVDSVIVGNFIGSNALAAVSSAGNLIFMIIGFFSGIAIGAGVIIARFIGAKDDKRTVLAVHSTVALGFVFSVILTIVGVLGAPMVLKLMSTPKVVLKESIVYFQVYFAGSIGFVMYNTFVGIIQATGDSRHPLYYLVMSSIVNIVLDLLLIGKMGFGVGAAAFATAISQFFSAILCIRYLMKSKEAYRLQWRKVKFDKEITLKIIKYGLPSGLQNSIMSLSNVVIQSYINSYGHFAMAGIGAFVKIEGFIFIPVTSFTMAITTFVSQNLGAQKLDRVKKGIRFGLICTLLSAESLGIILFSFAPKLISFFDKNKTVIEYGAQRAHIVCLFFFLCAYTHFMSAVLRGIGRPMVPMFVFLFCWCVVRIIFLAVVNIFIHTIYTTYWVYPLTWILSALVLTLYYKNLNLNDAIRDMNV
ncbi:MATE family efflux transporter [Lachnobacterium bovis]|uniref:Putative efflux protein, MATE family n=1 Tax=Lachnobacterium bovis TaxID=140626 RepID=A0A1H9PWY9_9FIRM|nr:MATE family efflux transporter [Lachnobacterium bovis]SER52680.1 putative efflux protein, MATE family [Lachnobacterium bovis]